MGAVALQAGRAAGEGGQGTAGQPLMRCVGWDRVFSIVANLSYVFFFKWQHEHRFWTSWTAHLVLLGCWVASLVHTAWWVASRNRALCCRRWRCWAGQ